MTQFPIDLRMLTVLEAVDRQHSFTRAAEELGVTQASVSQRIKQLESEVGTTLIDRAARTATEPGRILIEAGRRASRMLENAHVEVDELLGVERGTLRLGAIDLVGFVDLPGMLAAFHRSHPGVDVSLTAEFATAMIDKLQMGALDLVIANAPPDESVPAGCDRTIIATEPLVIVSPPRSTDPNRATPMVTFPVGSNMRAIVDRALDELGRAPRIAFETTRTENMEGLVASGMAWTIVPASVAHRWTHGLEVVPVDMPTQRCVAVTWSTGGGFSPAAKAFRDLVVRATAR